MVGLEEKLLQVQSQQLKAGRAAESASDDLRKAAVTLARTQAEAASLAAALAALQVSLT